MASTITGSGRARIPCALSIAGSDSGGGAGIQADLKAFAACGVHGLTAITAITAQNTVGVSAVHPVPPEVIVAQVRSVVQDIGVDAVKIGMLGTAETIEAVTRALDELAPGTPVVLDPVMVSESGAELLEPSARGVLLKLVVARATVVTPNVPEALALLGVEAGATDTAPADIGAEAGPSRPEGVDVPGPARAQGVDVPGLARAQGVDVPVLARAIHALGHDGGRPRAVVVTGGHRENATDVFYDGARLVEIPGERYPDGAAHGSGCTHSSVLAARLAWGDTPLQAARTAKRRAAEAVRDGLSGIGSGPGPVDILRVT